VWRPAQGAAGAGKAASGSTLAVYARTRDGIFSGAAPLLRSSLPVRAVNYLSAADPESGVLGIIQDAGEEFYLIRVQWKHRDFSR
jgi:hypothetical protein